MKIPCLKLLVLIISLSCYISVVEANSYDRKQLVLAYTYNFAKFIDWSFLANKQQITFCFYGKAEQVYSLTSLQNKTVSSRQVITQKLHRGSDIRHCNILFIENSERIYLKHVFDSVKGLPIVTVSMIEGFVEQGGSIGFIVKENKLRFDINRRVLETVGISMSSQLYRLANHVIQSTS